MTYFSRLSDIVSCNLTELLAQAADPAATLRQLISEMEEGLAGARRSVQAAAKSVERLQCETGEHKAQWQFWMQQARDEVAAGREQEARESLRRKRELEDLLEGLDQQLAAAVSTHEHLQKMHRAIEARVAETRRRLEGDTGDAPSPTGSADSRWSSDPAREAQIEEELAALRREVAKGRG